MGKIDRVDDLGDTLCGLADGDVDCPDNLPDMAIENVEATLMMANAEINVAGYKLLRGVNLKLKGQIQDLPDSVLAVKNALGFPAGKCVTPGGTEFTVDSRAGCEAASTGRRRMQCADEYGIPQEHCSGADGAAAGNVYTALSQSVLTASVPMPTVSTGRRRRSTPSGTMNPSLAFGFEKMAGPVTTEYLGCSRRVSDDWAQTYSLGVSDAPAVECASKCKSYRYMALSWFDQCSCGMDAGTGDAVGGQLCDSDGDGSPDLCATGDLESCRNLVAAYKLTRSGSEGIDLVAVSMYITKTSAGLDLGVKGTILTNVDDQALYWEVQASVVFTGLSMPTFILGGRLLTPWLGIAGVEGLDLHDAALYIGLKPGQPGFAYINVRADLRIGANTNFKGELYFDARSFPPKALVKVEANNFNMIALLEFIELRTGVTIVSELPQLLFDKFQSMGWTVRDN